MILMIGIGNQDRGDDAAGLEVARRIRQATNPGKVTVRELIGDQLALLDAWAGATEVYVVDAVCTGGTPGTVYQFDAANVLTDRFTHRGTHTFSLAGVIELARALDRLPRHLAGYGIEGDTFEAGAAMSAPVRDAVEKVTGMILADLKAGV